MEPKMQRTLEFCLQNYHPILPYTDDKAYQQQQIAQIIQCLKQYEILIQLLVQNALFCKTEEQRRITMAMIGELEHQIDPKFQLDLNNFNQDLSLILEIAPLDQNLQFPLLKMCSQILSAKDDADYEKFIHLKKFTPIINTAYLPKFCSPQTKKKCKFVQTDELLLYQGLMKYGSKYYILQKKNFNRNLQAIKDEFLRDKTIKQIKNKYKNSICSNAPQNKIKQWKLNQYEYLNAQEMTALQRGINWYGKESPQLIQKYFLRHRTQEFIENELRQSDQLKIKRKKHSIPDQYPNYYDSLWESDKKRVQLKSVVKDAKNDVDLYFNMGGYPFELSNNFISMNQNYQDQGGFSRLPIQSNFYQLQKEDKPSEEKQDEVRLSQFKLDEKAQNKQTDKKDASFIEVKLKVNQFLLSYIDENNSKDSIKYRSQEKIKEKSKLKPIDEQIFDLKKDNSNKEPKKDSFQIGFQNAKSLIEKIDLKLF